MTAIADMDFKKWVIDVALSQINEHSDLSASYAQRKTGRNVTHLIFTFAPKEEAQPQPAAQGSALLQPSFRTPPIQNWNKRRHSVRRAGRAAPCGGL